MEIKTLLYFLNNERESTSGVIWPKDTRGNKWKSAKDAKNLDAILEDHIRRFQSYISHCSRFNADKKISESRFNNPSKNIAFLQWRILIYNSIVFPVDW